MGQDFLPSGLKDARRGTGRITFIRSAASGRLGRFHVLAVVHSAASNMVCKYLCKFLFSLLWGIYPEVELLEHMIILFLIF